MGEDKGRESKGSVCSLMRGISTKRRHQKNNYDVAVNGKEEEKGKEGNGAPVH